MSKAKRMKSTHQNVRTVTRPQTGPYKGVGEAKAGNKRRDLPKDHPDRTHDLDTPRAERRADERHKAGL